MDTGYINYVFVDQSNQVMEIHSTDEKTYNAIDPKQFNPSYRKMKIVGSIGTLIADRKKGHYVEQVTGLQVTPSDATNTLIDDSVPNNVKTFVVRLKQKVTITAIGPQIYTNDGTGTARADETCKITHDAPVPVMIYANSRPLLDDQNGAIDGRKGYSVHSTIASDFILKVRDPRYYSDPVTITAVPRPAPGSSGSNPNQVDNQGIN